MKIKNSLLRFFLTPFFILFVAVQVFPQEIPKPADHFGFQLGADQHLATYQQAYEYFQILDKASPKFKVFEMGKTEMGKPQIGAIITSERNMAELAAFKRIAERLALAKGLTDEEARKLAEQGRAVVYIDGGLHASECAPPQALPELAYDLITVGDADTKAILDNVVLLLCFANPDGMDLLAEWYHPNVGTKYEISPMPWVYNKYVGHDNNRDSYMNNMQETRNITKLVMKDWHPQILLNHHQTAPFPARIWVPPHAEPSNPNIHPLMFRWQNLLGTAMGLFHDRTGQEGAISRTGFDSWYPGYVTHSVDSRNIISLLTEIALHRYATPKEYTLDDFPEWSKDFKTGVFYPSPWKPGWWRLRDAVEYAITSSKAVLHAAAVYKEKLLYDRYQMGRDVINRFEESPPYAWIVPKDQRDLPSTALFLRKMQLIGLEVHELDQSFEYKGVDYPAGTWVIPMNQAFGLHAKALFEVQHYPDMLEYPPLWQGVPGPKELEGAYFGPQDTCGWTLPYQLGIDMIEVADKPLTVGTTLLEDVRVAGGVEDNAPGYAYLLSPAVNNTFIAMNRIVKNGGKLFWAKESFEDGGNIYPPGTVIVPSVSVDGAMMNALAEDLSVEIAGIDDEVSVETYGLSAPRVALYKSWTASMDEGWTRWLFEQFEFAFKNVFDEEIRRGNLGAYDVLVIPAMSTQAIVQGHREGTIPPKYAGGISEIGVKNIKTFVEQGGTLVLLNGGCMFAADELGVPVQDALESVRTYSGRGDSGVPEFVCPGSLIRMKFDSSHPVAYGMPDEAAAYFTRSPVFETSSEVEVVGRYPARDLLMSGYLKGEEFLQHKAGIVEYSLGKGKVIMLGFAVQNRAQPFETFRLLFNSLYYGAAE
jgi:hypothetical protein